MMAPDRWALVTTCGALVNFYNTIEDQLSFKYLLNASFYRYYFMRDNKVIQQERGNAWHETNCMSGCHVCANVIIISF